MFYSGFAENKRTESNSIAELIEAFCVNQGKKYSEPCSKPHTGANNVFEASKEKLSEAFKAAGWNLSDSDAAIYFVHEYDMETEIRRPVSDRHADPSRPILLSYPFEGPPIYGGVSQSRPVAQPRQANSLGRPSARVKDPAENPKNDDESDEDESDEEESDDDDEAYFTPGPFDDEKDDSVDLDTIVEETERDYQESESLEFDADLKALAKPLTLKERRAFLEREFDKYKFEEVNPMLDLEDPFREAMRKMSEGSLTMAIMYLEASVQRRPSYSYPKKATAWLFLGLCRAANDQDILAIAALRECVKIEPNNLNAWLALAASYANEGLRNHAIEAIWQWLYNEPNYYELDVVLVPQDASTMYQPLDIEVHSKVLRMLLVVAYRYHRFMDINLLYAIATMYTLTGQFERAINYFNVAAMLRPRDERLWNHLGACLASINCHDEAIVAYCNAIVLVPGYVRVRFNWAISCSRLKAYKDAIKQLLRALNYQTNTVNGVVGKTNDTFWMALKKLMVTQKNPQLEKAVQRRDLNFLNGAFGIE